MINIRNFAAAPDEENVANLHDVPDALPGCSTIKTEDGWGEVSQNDLNNLTRPKGEDGKRIFYCDLCLVVLSSVDTMESHKNGAKHRKKKITYEQKNYIPPGNDMSYIREVKAEKTAPKKIPIRLNEKLKESQQPIVGLR